MKEINDLPFLVWRQIFQNLSIEDLFNCRLVNKKFKEFSDNSNHIHRLFVGENSYPLNNYWKYNNELLADNEITSLNYFKLIHSLSLFNLDKNLRCLNIDFFFKSNETLNLLSNLINLESLEIYHFNTLDYRLMYYEASINLENLKNFIITLNYIGNLFCFKLNTPKLEKIQFAGMTNIKFKSNPNSIRHLITYKYDKELKIFKNLEIIELEEYYDCWYGQLILIDENILSIFKNLKQLKIHNIYPCNDKLIQQIKDNLINILNDKKRLKREFDIYLKGIRIDIYNLNQFFDNYSNLKCFFQNYDQLDLNLPLIQLLSYDDLENYFHNVKLNLPSSFFDKFFNISLIEINSVNNVDNLIWFLNNLKRLNQLFISNLSLNEIFYNNLPNSIRNLVILKCASDLNLDFIFKCTNLDSFCIFELDKDLFDLAIKSFLNLKNLSFFKFDFKNIQISIHIYRSLWQKKVKFRIFFFKKELNEPKNNEEDSEDSKVTLTPDVTYFHSHLIYAEGYDQIVNEYNKFRLLKWP